VYIVYIYSIISICGRDKKLNIIISNYSQEPIYEQIVRQVKNIIIRGELAENEALPSIRSLARDLQISVITTKKAYEKLEKEGYIVTVQGKGSFVAAQNKELLKEMRLKIVEEKLAEAVDAGRSIELSVEEMQEMLKILYEEV
jgi:GntR family transcriptional regulator